MSEQTTFEVVGVSRVILKTCRRSSGKKKRKQKHTGIYRCGYLSRFSSELFIYIEGHLLPQPSVFQSYLQCPFDSHQLITSLSSKCSQNGTPTTKASQASQPFKTFSGLRILDSTVKIAYSRQDHPRPQPWLASSAKIHHQSSTLQRILHRNIHPMKNAAIEVDDISGLKSRCDRWQRPRARTCRRISGFVEVLRFHEILAYWLGRHGCVDSSWWRECGERIRSHDWWFGLGERVGGLWMSRLRGSMIVLLWIGSLFGG